jgi:dCMP deaminase
VERPSWDDYFLDLSDQVATRATCDRGRSGCVIVREHRIVSTGYVGSPPGLPHCDDVGHVLKTVVDEDGQARQHCMRTIHAEQNAICQAARWGVALEGAALYCRMVPCRVCAMLIISTGIRRVVARNRYHAGADSEAMLKAAEVELEIRNPAIESYEGQSAS